MRAIPFCALILTETQVAEQISPDFCLRRYRFMETNSNLDKRFAFD